MPPKYLVAIVFFISALTFQIAAQTRTNSSGTGGINTIQGRVYGPSGMMVEIQVNIRLESNSFPTLTLSTDSAGGYVFQNISPGNYTIVADAGDRFEIAREPVTIDPMVQMDPTVRLPPTPRTINVPIYLQLKRSEAVRIDSINAKLASLPKPATEHYKKGLEFEQEKKTDEAADEFRRALAVEPNFPECEVELGKTLLTHGKLSEAAAEFRKAVRLDDRSFDAHVNLGVALLGQRLYNEAEPELVTAAYLDPSAVTPHYYIGLMYLERDDLPIAQKAFETARGLPGGDKLPLLHRGLGGIYLKQGMKKEAVAELERYLQLMPKAPDADKIRQTINELKMKFEKLNVFS